MTSTCQAYQYIVYNIFLCVTFANCTNYHVNLTKFPPSPDFIFGVGVSSYQIEGAWNISNKGANIWDVCTHIPGNIIDGSNGDITCDSYHKSEVDIRMLSQLKVDFYRFSISWTRLFPHGLVNVLNQAGVDYYNKLINDLIKNGIEPIVTIFHWDTPMYLKELGGWANDRMIIWFLEYADKLFHLFGDRVKVWSTMNEPANFCIYSNTYTLPNMSWPFVNSSGVASYLCAHNQIKAHAKAYRLYQKKYKKIQKGVVGISLDCDWYEPANSKSDSDKNAVQFALEFHFGWFAWPIFKTGDYPLSMRKRLNKRSKDQGFTYSRLPEFTSDEKSEILGSADFLGLNHYSTFMIKFDNQSVSQEPTIDNDLNCKTWIDSKWEKTAGNHMTVRPESLYKLLKWIDKELGHNLDVFISENGYNGLPNETLNDSARINYMNSYLEAVLKAINHGVNVIGYTWWSLMDNFEWLNGYTKKFGLYHVDFASSNKTRVPKKSAWVYQNIVVTRQIDREFNPKNFIH